MSQRKFLVVADDTPEFRTALSDYQRDQGQAATGALDAKTAALLSVFQR